MDADENPYQAQFDQWDRYYRNVVMNQQHTLPDTVGVASEGFTTCDVSTARTISLASLLYDVNVDIPLTARNSYSEDFDPNEEYTNADVDGLERRDLGRPLVVSQARSRNPSETSSTFTVPIAAEASPSDMCINNQMHNKYALSPETSAYANELELAGLFNATHVFGNVDDPENLRHTYLRDFCKGSLEDLRALPDPFPPKMRYLFE